MNQTTVTQIRNGKIVLPKALQKDWQTGEALFTQTQDGFFIKSLVQPSLAILKPKLKKLGKVISQKDIKEAIKSARQKVYASNS